MPLIGSCHCKGTRFEVVAAPESVTACTCSICSKRGALWAYYKASDVRIVSKDGQGTYQWGMKFGRHNFCGICGCSTYTESPDFSTGAPDYDKLMININARLFDDFDLDSIPHHVIDGKNLW